MNDLIFLGLNGYAWVTLLTLIAIIVWMIRRHQAPEVALLAGVTVLLVTGVVSEKEAMSGFGSEPVIIHAAFFVIIAALMQSGVLYWLTKHWLGNPRSYSNALWRLMLPVSALAAVLNSVNVVALFIDAVKIWSRKLNVPASKLLMPLSYAATFGGMCTLLGNSSNIVVAGLYMQESGEALNIFTPLVPGLVITVVGTMLVLLLHRQIPVRESPEQTFETTSDYTVELLVPTDNPAVAHTVAESGLMSVKGGSLVEIVRFDKEIIMPVSPTEYIMGGDRLIYAGQIAEILELKQTHGLVAADHHVWSLNEIDSNRKLRTAYVSFGSDLIGQRMAQATFESDHDVALVAVARGGHRVEGQPREVVLQAGDSLLLECPPKADEQLERENRRSLTFFQSHFVPTLGRRTVVAALFVALMFVASSTHLMPLMATTMLAAGLMMATGCCRMNNVSRYIDWELLLVLGSIVVLSQAITNAGIAEAIAAGVLSLCEDNPYMVMVMMCVVASLLSEFVSDVGACAIFFPIVWRQAMLMDCNPMPFVLSLMFSVAVSFATPLGSSTHMLIFGPGSFKFSDFARVGIVLHVVLLALCLVVVNLLYPLHT